MIKCEFFKDLRDNKRYVVTTETYIGFWTTLICDIIVYCYVMISAIKYFWEKFFG